MCMGFKTQNNDNNTLCVLHKRELYQQCLIAFYLFRQSLKWPSVIYMLKGIQKINCILVSSPPHNFGLDSL